jgi:hypothetical protein
MLDFLSVSDDVLNSPTEANVLVPIVLWMEFRDWPPTFQSAFIPRLSASKPRA